MTTMSSSVLKCNEFKQTAKRNKNDNIEDMYFIKYDSNEGKKEPIKYAIKC